MFALGKMKNPLGWDKSYKNKKTKQDLFYKLISKNMPTTQIGNLTCLYFPDVLDNITLFYVIR